MTTDAEYELMEARADREIDRLSDENERLRAELRTATADRAALDVAVNGLRELETTWARDADAAEEWADRDGDVSADILRESVRCVSGLLDKIGGTR